MAAFDWTRDSLLVRDGRLCESSQLPAASVWGRGHALTLEEAKSWINVYSERLRRASIAVTGEDLWHDMGQVWVNNLGAKK